MTTAVSASSIRPARVTFHSPDLRTNVRRGIGWRAECDCEERFPVRKAREQAREDKRLHLLEKHGGAQ